MGFEYIAKWLANFNPDVSLRLGAPQTHVPSHMLATLPTSSSLPHTFPIDNNSLQPTSIAFSFLNFVCIFYKRNSVSTHLDNFPWFKIWGNRNPIPNIQKPTHLSFLYLSHQKKKLKSLIYWKKAKLYLADRSRKMDPKNKNLFS